MIPNIEILTQEITEAKIPTRTYKIGEVTALLLKDCEKTGTSPVIIDDAASKEHELDIQLSNNQIADFSQSFITKEDVNGAKSYHASNQEGKVEGVKSSYPITKLSVSENVPVEVEGTAVSMTDISPLKHNIGVKLASDTITDFSSVAFTKWGKNILPHPYVATTMSQGGIDWTYNEDGTLIANGTPIENYAVFFNLTKANLFKDGVTYTVGVGNNDVFSIGLEVFDNQVNKQISINTANPFTWDSSRYEMRIMYIMNTKVATVSGMVIKPQVEVGTVATEFEPYKAPETVSVNADGTAFIIGNGESMTLMTDTEGVKITANYNTSREDSTTAMKVTYKKEQLENVTKIVGFTDNIDALKQTIYLILSSERYKFNIYSWDYGVELMDLYGEPMNYIMASLPRRIKEALTQDNRITDVIDFNFEKHGTRLHTTFTVVTNIGNIPTELEVTV